MEPIELRAAWELTAAVCERRRRLLFDALEWELVRRLILSRQPHFDRMEPRARTEECGLGWSRGAWSYALPADEFDLFYNGPTGYRAQFCLGSSAQHGRNENKRMIEDAHAACIAAVPKELRDIASLSIATEDAKVCVDKYDIPNVDEVQIAFAPWVRRRNTGARFANTGVLAPLAPRIWIKGGWVRAGETWRDPVKMQRAESFREFGFG